MERKKAQLRCKIADAKFREALTKAKLCRSRSRHAKTMLDVANSYMTHVQWTVERSEHGAVLSAEFSDVVTNCDTRGTQGVLIISV
jgi:hypothetical protein